MKIYLLTLLILMYYVVAAIVLRPLLPEHMSILKPYGLPGNSQPAKIVKNSLPGNWPPPIDKSSLCGSPEALTAALLDTMQLKADLLENLGDLQHTVSTSSA